MNSRLWFLPMVFISLLFISATTASSDPKPVLGYKVSAELPVVATSIKKPKLNFVERLALKYVLHRFKKAEDTANADKLAKSSLTFGIVAVSLLLIGIFVPYVILASIPAGVVALVQGSSALKSGTSETGKATTGKALGLASLIAFGALILIALAVVASFSGWG